MKSHPGWVVLQAFEPRKSGFMACSLNTCAQLSRIKISCQFLTVTEVCPSGKGSWWVNFRMKEWNLGWMSEGHQSALECCIQSDRSRGREGAFSSIQENPWGMMASSGAVWMIVKKARSGWEASLPGGPTLGTSTRQERRKQIWVIGRDAPEWAPGDPESLRESLRAQEGPQKLSTGQQSHRD